MEDTSRYGQKYNSPKNYEREAIIKETTSVWFKSIPGKKRIFHCHLCQYPLFSYEGEVTMIVPGDANNAPKEGVEANIELQVVKAPFRVQCKGVSKKYGRCPITYLFEGNVES